MLRLAAKRPFNLKVAAALGGVGLLVLGGIVAMVFAQRAGRGEHAAVPPPSASPVSLSPGSLDVAAKLKAVGAGTCAAQLDLAAAGTMGNVAASNFVSNWAKTAIDRRMTSVSLGQKYPAGSPVPYAATTVVAAPNPAGACDAVAVQVVPSPMSCETVRASLAASSKLLGDLAGVQVMQNDGGETMLVPTSTNACVLVGVRTAFAK